MYIGIVFVYLFTATKAVEFSTVCYWIHTSSNITVVNNTKFLPIQLCLFSAILNVQVFALLGFVFVNDVSGQRIGIIYKGQDVEEERRELFLRIWIAYFTSRIKTKKCTYVKYFCRCCHHHQVTYKNVWNPNSLSKCMNEPLDVTKNASDFLYIL